MHDSYKSLLYKQSKQVIHHELKDGGANIPVTEENKREYVLSVACFQMPINTNTSSQYLSFFYFFYCHVLHIIHKCIILCTV